MSSAAPDGRIRDPARDSDPALEERTTVDLLRRITDDLGNLVRMEALLARQELERSLEHSVQAIVAVAVAAVFAIVALVILGLAAIAMLDGVLPDWAAALVVGGTLAALAVLSLGFAKARVANLSIKPEAATREVKEDIEWAKTRLQP